MAAGARITAGLALASAATLLAALIWLAEPDPAVDPGPGPADPVRVGVLDGQSVPGYLDASRGELSALAHTAGAGDTWALVTLRSYLAPDRLPPILGGVAVAQVYARAPLGGMPTAVVRIPAYRLPDDVVAGMLATADRRDQERAGFERLSRRLSGTGPNEIRLRRAYDDAARAAGDEATAYRAHCSCVFAAVVHATPAVLAAVAGRTGVRVVDPAPEVGRLDRAEFRPPLPDGPPSATRSTLTGAARVAPATPTPVPSSLGASVTSASPDDPAAGSGPSVPASEEQSAVPSAPSPGRDTGRGPGAPTATAGASGR
jgi:hypothetical protein